MKLKKIAKVMLSCLMAGALFTAAEISQLLIAAINRRFQQEMLSSV